MEVPEDYQEEFVSYDYDTNINNINHSNIINPHINNEFLNSYQNNSPNTNQIFRFSCIVDKPSANCELFQ